MILVYPPVAKPGEPPAGLARLSGMLSVRHVDHIIVDANLESLLFIIDNSIPDGEQRNDTWTQRSLKNIVENYRALKDVKTYRSRDRYKRAVIDLNHAVESYGGMEGTAGIANFRHKTLSPLRSADLIRASLSYEESLYFPYFSKRFSELINNTAVQFIGFSLNYLSQALSTFAMIGYVKKEFPRLEVIIGGGLVTSWMSNPSWQSPFQGIVDHLVAGPGEGKLMDILGMKKDKGLVSVPNYASLPVDRYLSPGMVLPYSASSGCYWNKCSFCPEKSEANAYIPLKPHEALSQLNGLISETSPSLVHILDNSINISLLKELADNPIGVPWYGFTRLSPMLADPDFCMRLKLSGCVLLKVGLESGDQHVLDEMQKGIDIPTASRSLKALKRAGIATYVYLIFGTPAENEHAAMKTLEFVVNHREEITFLNVAIFNMPLYSADAEKYETRQFYAGDLSLYTDFKHPDQWDRIKVRKYLENDFKRNRAVAEILKNDPPFLTSNHAPFFVMDQE